MRKPARGNSSFTSDEGFAAGAVTTGLTAAGEAGAGVCPTEAARGSNVRLNKATDDIRGITME